MDNALTGWYHETITWCSNAIHKPENDKSYLCWVAVYGYENGKKVVIEQRHDIRTYADGRWWDDDTVDGSEVVAWAELPKCAFYLDEVK